MKHSALWAAAALSFSVSTALAATDGTLGSSSTASMSVSAEIVGRPNGVKVSGVQDINFGVVSVLTTFAQSVCLYHSSPTVTIEARRVGDAGGTALYLKSSDISNGWRLRLRGYFLRPDGTETPLPGTGYLTTNQTFNRQSENCETGGRTSLGFEVSDAYLGNTNVPLNEAPAGVYTANIQLVLTPE